MAFHPLGATFSSHSVNETQVSTLLTAAISVPSNFLYLHYQTKVGCCVYVCKQRYDLVRSHGLEFSEISTIC